MKNLNKAFKHNSFHIKSVFSVFFLILATSIFTQAQSPLDSLPTVKREVIVKFSKNILLPELCDIAVNTVFFEKLKKDTLRSNPDTQLLREIAKEMKGLHNKHLCAEYAASIFLKRLSDDELLELNELFKTDEGINARNILSLSIKGGSAIDRSAIKPVSTLKPSYIKFMNIYDDPQFMPEFKVAIGIYMEYLFLKAISN